MSGIPELFGSPRGLPILVVLLLVLAFGFTLWHTAGRLDRLHRRVMAARAHMARHLIKRAGHALQLAKLPVMSERDARRLQEAATNALVAAEHPLAPDGLDRAVGPADPSTVQKRLEAESHLSALLRMILTPSMREKIRQDPLGAAQLESFDQESYRAALARSLHNQDVTHVRHLRSRPLARFFHLAGKAPLPVWVDLDDDV